MSELDEHTAERGPGTGWDLHEYRHCALTHLGEQGTSLLMAKSRRKKSERVRRYFKPLAPFRPSRRRHRSGLLVGEVRRLQLQRCPCRHRQPP